MIKVDESSKQTPIDGSLPLFYLNHSKEPEYSDSKIITHTMEDGTTVPIAEILSKCRGEYPSTESVQAKVEPIHSVGDVLNRIYGTGPIESKKGQPRHLAKYTRKRHKRKK